MVSFHDNPEKYNNPAMLHNIDQEVSMRSSFGVGLVFETCLTRCPVLQEKGSVNAGSSQRALGARQFLGR